MIIFCFEETTRNHIFSKEISQVIIAAMVLAPISIEKIVWSDFSYERKSAFIVPLQKNLENIVCLGAGVEKYTLSWSLSPKTNNLISGTFPFTLDMEISPAAQLRSANGSSLRAFLEKDVFFSCLCPQKIGCTKILRIVSYHGQCSYVAT